MSTLLHYSKTTTPFYNATLDLPPCCMEAIPYEYSQGQWFVVGTYGLKQNQENAEESQSRHGTLNLYRLHERSGNPNLELVQNIHHPAGIYDLHFRPGTPVFALATTIGCILIYKIVQLQNSQLRIDHVASHQVFEQDVIVTSFAWYPSQGPPLLAATTSNGTVSLVSFKDETCQTRNSTPLDGDIIVHERYGEPQYAYCCAWAGSTLFSGGDDSYLRMANDTIRDFGSAAASHVPEKFEPHGAGILAILPFTVPTHLDPFETTNKSNLILFTGGYDDYFRVFSPRGKPEVLAELRIGHGVYKLKFLQDLGTLSADQDIKLQVLASCTNAGVRILEITGKDGGRGEWSINILASMTQHQSLCYASDVMPVYSTEKNGRRVIISTSMYDKLLCVWTFDDSIWKEEGDGISEPRRDDELIKSEVID